VYSFYALVARTKNIDRWALMRNAEKENVQEHSHMVSVLAHALATIRRDIYGKSCSPEKCAVAAIFHDVPEIFTGDMPTPVKYHDDEMINAYRRIESVAVDRLVNSLPQEMRPEYKNIFSPSDEEKEIVHAADKLSAYIKCLSELKAGNEEFRSASQSTLLKLKSMEMPEIDYFLENFIPAFEKTLDEISL
jgi:5'-deoxynucleotidase